MHFKIDSHVKAPKQRKVKLVPDNVRKAYAAYSDAYKRVHGVAAPQMLYSKLTAFIHIGNEPGVSLQRLKELTRMLMARVER